MFNDEQAARSNASDASREHGRNGAHGATARYAVYPADAVQEFLDGTVALLVSRPLFVPAGSEDLAGFYRWPVDLLASGANLSVYWETAPRNAFTLAPVPSVPAVPEAVDPAPAPAPVAPVVRFEVRAGLQGTNRDEWGCVHQADDGKAAADWANANRAMYREGGKSLAIVRVEVAAPSVDWRERERERFASGEYLPLPGDFAGRVARAYPDHFAHLSQGDKRKVAFTETEAAGERDRQKVLSAAEYARRFFSDQENAYSRDPMLSGRFWRQSTQTDFVGAMLGSSLVPLFAPLGDAAAMERVYNDTFNGPAHGCMSALACYYNTGGIHPTAAYAEGGEITVALLRGYGDGEAPEPEDDGDECEGGAHEINPNAVWDGPGIVLARCLVWDDSEGDSGRKQYGRVYGMPSHARALRTSLEALGYRDGDLYGARIAKLPVDCRGDNAFVMPYLDIGGGQVTDCGDYFKAGGDISATRTDGLVYCIEMVECEHCGDEEIPESDTHTVYVAEHDAETWCDTCRRNDAFMCEHSGMYVSDNRRADYVPSGRTWEDSIADWLLDEVGASLCNDGVYRVDTFECADCEETFAASESWEWEGGDTGEASHARGDSLCSSCHSERECMADEVERAASEPELPLPSAA